MITALHQTYPDLSIRRLCTLFGVSRTWYYTHPSPDVVAERDVALRDAIEQLVLALPGYGYRRVTKQLQRDGWAVNHKRVQRVMRQESLLCQLKRRFVVTTAAQHGLGWYPNLVADLVVERPDQVWLADITYIRLPTAFVYLACLLDAGAPSGSTSLCWLGALAHDRHRAHAGRPRQRPGDPPAATGLDPPLGSRRAVCQR